MSKTTVRTLFLMLIIAAGLVSCVSQKKILYLQSKQEKDTSIHYSLRSDTNYRLQIKDNLYIRLYSLDPNSSIFFNKSGGTSYNDYANDASIYLNAYSVDDDGDIEFPVLGRIHVRGRTILEVSQILKDKVSEYIKEVSVTVKLVNFKVTVLGEVGKPGELTLYQNQVNIFEIISQSGDLGEFANRAHVALIRKTKGGSQVHYIDLNRIDILQSEFYYLQPNDIVYVPPLAYKRWGLGSTFPWAFIFGTISTTLLLINYFK